MRFQIEEPGLGACDGPGGKRAPPPLTPPPLRFAGPRAKGDHPPRLFLLGLAVVSFIYWDFICNNAREVFLMQSWSA
jgi:hypothetical protein